MPTRVLKLGERLVDLDDRTLIRDGVETRLSAREAALLRYLVARPGVVIPRATLLVEVWGYAPHVRSRAVDATVARLRQKIEDDRENPAHLLTVHGAGYRFLIEPSANGARPCLPPARRRVVGRSPDVQALVEALDTSRLVTVVGPPGVGKSVVCEALVRSLSERQLEGGVWICRCAEVSSEAELLAAVAGGLQLELGPGFTLSSARDSLGRTLVERGDVVLILDDFDRSIPFVASLARWLDLAPRARVVVTSRERLRLRGERVYALRPLDETVGRGLFCALADDLGISVEVPEHHVVDDIVRALDGLPLAIELAAARLSVLDPPELLRRLEHRFAVLRSHRLEDCDRHASLQRCFDWSWDVLSASERRALMQCTALHTPFTLAEAEAVLDLEEPVVDVLQSLLDRSLLTQTGRPRSFWMLETTRAYVAQYVRDDEPQEGRCRSARSEQL
ncbi:MAG: winged helix-turn-helix domain-containing protein [Myxococcales bacterium]|nr:winged helix-turn-helix domain-containing protein [Myxococcales bacterium]